MPSADDTPNSLSHATHVDVVRLVISSAEPGPKDQSAVTPGSVVGEHERLLDIDGLLKIARLIGKVGSERTADLIVKTRHTPNLPVFGAGLAGKVSILSAASAFASGAHGFPYLSTAGVLDENPDLRPHRVRDPNTAAPSGS